MHSAKGLVFAISFACASVVIAAPCAGFNDVSDVDATYCAAVTYLKNKGITLGCTKPGGPNYCPDDPVTRLQMALFLQRMARGGANNVQGDYKNTVSGGDNNTSMGSYATVGGGYTNTANAAYSTIAGGLTNMVSGGQGVVGGGLQNTVSAGYGSILGGAQNSVTAAYASVGGGYTNAASGARSTVSGGLGNSATGVDAIVAGGSTNIAGDNITTVSGGTNNVAGIEGATVAGGSHNGANGGASTISGGAYNQTLRTGSTVPGGAYNTATGQYSFAAGYKAYASGDGCFTWGDSSTENQVTCGNDNGFVARALGGVFFLTSGNSDATYHGAVLAPGSGSWTTYSDRNGKDRIVPVDAAEVLTRVLALPVATWHYKPQADGITHIGPMAQDFYAAFGLGETDKGISTVDGQGVALAAIQGLNAKLESQLEAKEARIADLTSRLERLEALLTH